MAGQMVVASFPTYQAAHACMEKLHQAGLNDFSVLYLQNKGDENGDGAEGFYPGVTPEIQSVIDAPVQGEIEAPQMYVLPGVANQRTMVPVEERLRSYGIPEQTVTNCCNEVRSGHTLCVLRDSQRMENIASLLKGEADFCELVTG